MTTETKPGRVGRPPLTEPNPDNARIEVRMPAELRRRIRIAAAAADESLQEWMRRAALDRLGKPKAAPEDG